MAWPALHVTEPPVTALPLAELPVTGLPVSGLPVAELPVTGRGVPAYNRPPDHPPNARVLAPL
ncbi:MAG: hypothetical protein AAF790_09730 [Planctomycetota bacterium]